MYICILKTLGVLLWAPSMQGQIQTRMHSSRMRAIHCSGCLHWGVCIGGVCPGGVSAWGCLPRGSTQGRVSAQGVSARQPPQWRVLNVGYILNETNADVCMYIEEFILVEISIHCCTNWKWVAVWKIYWYLYKGWGMWELLLDDNWQGRNYRITMTWESVTWVN